MSFLERWLRSRRGECRECGAALRATTLSSVVGTAEGIQVEFSNLPVLACPSQGHPMRFATPDFGADLIDRVFDKGDLPITSSSRCVKCGTVLQSPNSHRGRISGDVPIQSLAPFRMSVTAPLSRCAGCGLEQLVATETVNSHLSDSMIAAFESVQLS